jgi:hypothetical protein
VLVVDVLERGHEVSSSRLCDLGVSLL